jgi:hypothetical protein
MANQVFISYQHADYAFASNLRYVLHENGFEAWLDDKSISPGDRYRQHIEDGLSGSFAVVVIVTPESHTSEYVTYEWSYALGKGKKIIPLLVRPTEKHPVLEQFSHIDCTSSRPSFDELIRRLREVQQETNQTATSVQPAETLPDDLNFILTRLYSLASTPVTASEIIITLSRHGFLKPEQTERLLVSDRAFQFPKP